MNYIDLPLEELHEALVAKKVTPLELTEEALKRAHADKNNAFEFLDDEGAIAFAKTLTEPEKDNPLWGVPYFAKDNFSTKGIPTTASSNILVGYVPVYDATVISKLKAAKAVMIGKTTLDELAMGGTGTTGHLGKTFNPYDPKHAFEQANGVKIPYKIEARRAGDVDANFANCDKAFKEMGWKSRLTIVDACRDAYNFQKKNPNGIK